MVLSASFLLLCLFCVPFLGGVDCAEDISLLTLV
jgi:hypothetical protein